MTVGTTTRVKTYTGNGITTAFASTFQFFEIAVYIDAVLVDPSEYVITQSAPGLTGTITFNVAPPSASAIVISGDTSPTQQTDYVENSAFPAESHERAMDRLAMAIQELKRDTGYSVRWLDYPGRFVSINEDTGGFEAFDPANAGYVYLDANGVPAVHPINDLDTPQTLAATTQALAGLMLKVGDPILSMAPSPRAGFLRLGEAETTYAKASYPELSAFLASHSYPWGSTSTTFDLPAAAGYFLRFAATTTGVDPDGPRAAGSTQSDLVKAHTHTGTTASDGAHTHTIQMRNANIQSGSGAIMAQDFAGTNITGTTTSNGAHTHAVTIDANVGVENRAKNVAFHVDVLASSVGAMATLGCFGFAYAFDASTVEADPGDGEFRLNHATLASVTEIYLSNTDAWQVDQSNVYETISVGQVVRLSKIGAQGVTIVATVASEPTVGVEFTTIPVTVLSSGGAFVAADTTSFELMSGSNGEPGDPGAVGPNTGYDFAFDTGTADAHPGAGLIRVNNATLASATFTYISKTDRVGNSQGDQIGAWDDSTNAAHLGTLRVFDVATKTKGYTAEVTTAFTDGTSYWKIPHASISVLSGGAPSASDVLAVMWSRTGNKGTDGLGAGDVVGPAASVDSEIALFSSTTGKLLKRATTTGLLKAASGVMSAATAGADYYAPGSTDVAIADGGTGASDASGARTNLGLVIGTTVQAYASALTTWAGIAPSANAQSMAGAADYAAMRSLLSLVIGTNVQAYDADLTTWAGVTPGTGVTAFLATPSYTNLAAALTGSVLKTAGIETVWIPASAMTPRTTNGAAVGTTELATNDVMLSSLDFDTTTEEGAGFWIAFPKSWNRSTVTFQFYWTAASGSGGVAFGLAAYSFSDDDAMDTAVSGQQVVTDTLITANDMHITSVSSAMTIGGTPADWDAVYFELTREVANGSDTLAVDAKLLGIRLFFTTNLTNDA